MVFGSGMLSLGPLRKRCVRGIPKLPYMFFHTVCAVLLQTALAAGNDPYDSCGDDCSLELLQRKLSVDTGSHQGGPRKYTYGKYYDTSGEDQDNSMFVWWPKEEERERERGSTALHPVAVLIHDGGFLGELGMFPDGLINESIPIIEEYRDHGFVVISIGYRLLGTKYFWTAADGSERPEEFVDITLEKKLIPSNMTYYDVTPRISYYEAFPKCMYDAARAIDYIVDHASDWGIDPHRMVFYACSAGVGVSNYIMHFHHQWHIEKFTIKAMVFERAQLNYPVNPFLDQASNLLATAVGEDASLADFVEDDACAAFLACDLTGMGVEYDNWRCNQTWYQIRMDKFCSRQQYLNYTVGDLVQFNKWGPYPPGSYAELVGHLWANDQTLWDYADAAKNTWLYVANYHNGTTSQDSPHHSIFAAEYGRIAERRGLPYVVYYTDFPGIKDDYISSERFANGSYVFNYFSSVAWRSQPFMRQLDLKPVSAEEQVRFSCAALGMPDMATF